MHYWLNRGELWLHQKLIRVRHNATSLKIIHGEADTRVSKSAVLESGLWGCVQLPPLSAGLQGKKTSEREISSLSTTVSKSHG